MSRSKKLKLAWLRDSIGEYNYSRIIGSVMLLIFQPVALAYVFINDLTDKISNIYQWLTLSSPVLVAIILFLIDFFRDKESLKIHFGAVQVEFDKDNRDDADNSERTQE